MAPSKRHIELQNMAYRWIDNRCFKMCGLTECDVVGYLADLVAIGQVNSQHHQRYAMHSDLKTKSVSHRLKHDHQDRKGDDRWIRVVRGDIDRWFVCVFEVKVSRADFLNTFGGKESGHAEARMSPVGTAHWVVADKGICEPEELPPFWGLLTPYGAGLSEKKIPKLNILPDSHIHAMAFEMLFLRMNYRGSYYDQLIEMSKTVQNLNRAIMANKPQAELLRMSSKAMKACRGMVM